MGPEETVFPDDIDTFDGKTYSFYKSAENCMTIESHLFSCTDELDYEIYVDIEKMKMELKGCCDQLIYHNNQRDDN